MIQPRALDGSPIVRRIIDLGVLDARFVPQPGFDSLDRFALKPIAGGAPPIAGGAWSTYIHKDGALRMYDGTVPPFYIELFFVNSDFTAPTGRPRYEERLVLDRGTHKPDQGQLLTHYIRSSDDATLAPLELSFSIRLANTEPNRLRFRQAFNTDLAATWTVGSNTWVTTKGTTTVLNSAKTATMVTTPTFTDPRKRCANLEVLWLDPTTGGVATGYRWAEVYFPPDRQTVNETEDMVRINAVGMVYGEVVSITGFTAGVVS